MPSEKFLDSKAAGFEGESQESDALLFAKALKKLRSRKRKTVEDFASILEASPEEIEEWEAGKSFPDKEKLELLRPHCDDKTFKLVEKMLRVSPDALEQDKQVVRASYKPPRKP